MTDTPIVHLYINAHLGCGGMVAYTRRGANKRMTEDYRRASCRRCARRAPGLTDDQRQAIWDNANERLDTFTKSPWEKAAEQSSKREVQRTA